MFIKLIVPFGQFFILLENQNKTLKDFGFPNYILVLLRVYLLWGTFSKIAPHFPPYQSLG